jgi:hypothetical protein
MNLHRTILALALGGALTPAWSSVTAEEAAKLKTELTPFGAEKAGNKDGTIPEWTGGYTTPIPGEKRGGRRGDPFKDEKPLFTITAANADKYADKLTEGQKGMLKKYPDTWRIHVYKTHRTAAAPQWVYDNTFKNATRAKLNGDIVGGAYGGIPFPIPKTGAEVMWNHLLRWRGTSVAFDATQYQLTADGKAVMTTDGKLEQQMPYYFQDGSLEQFSQSNVFWQIRLLNVGPPIRAGEAITGNENLVGDKTLGWVYLTGQRRVRKMPNPCCDTPTPATAGVMSFDEIEVWNGRTDRFDWKLVGKKEMYIPYNTNKFLQPTTDAEVLGKNHPNPDHMRWELHRVWVVDANLRSGQRHQSPKSRYYCDEDTWTCVLAERWDANGQLWKTMWAQMFVAPDLPGLPVGSFGFNDFLSGQAFVSNLYNSKSMHYMAKPRFPADTFTADSLSGSGVR